MKKIFIYYSLSGNGDCIADYLRDKHVTIRKVIPKKELPVNKVLRILAGGFLAGINYKDELVNFNTDISLYDDVIIGSPIWNGRLATPINSMLDKIDLVGKKVTFILYSGSGKSDKITKKLHEKYEKANIINLKEPKKDKDILINMLKDI